MTAIVTTTAILAIAFFVLATTAATIYIVNCGNDPDDWAQLLSSPRWLISLALAISGLSYLVFG